MWFKYRKTDLCDYYEHGNMKSRNNLVERKGFVDSAEIRESISKINILHVSKLDF